MLHDREILVTCDDSVAYLRASGPALVRRSRGFVPDPVGLPGGRTGILAVGGMWKNTCCLTRDGDAFLSQHLGDLDSPAGLEHFVRSLEHLRDLLGVAPRWVACDLHPDYPSTRFARGLEGVELIPVQHHHAHLAACMADCGLTGEVIGLCLDGTGLGPDGTIWGGEALVGGYRQARRAARLMPFRLPGGDAAVRAPWRSAIGLLSLHFGEQTAADWAGAQSEADPDRRAAVARAAVRGVNSPWTSSLGRLFDAMAALLGVRQRVDFDAQAAMELEALADEGGAADLAFDLAERDGLIELDHRRLVASALALLADGVAPAALAAGFHLAVAEGYARVCETLRDRGAPGRVVLSGGCLLNRRLDDALCQALGARGFEVFCHRQVPANDGGLCLGQAAVAAWRTA